MIHLHGQTFSFTLRRWWNLLLNVLYPDEQSSCLLCHRPMQQLATRPAYENVQSHDGAYTDLHGVCPFCLQDAMHLSYGMRQRNLRVNGRAVPVLTAAVYEGLMRNAIRQWKYDGVVQLTEWFGSWVHHAYQRFLRTHPATTTPSAPLDFVVPVPTSADRLRKRGYDHVWLLAEALGTSANLAISSVLSRRSREGDVFTQSQTAKSASERRKSLAGVYIVDDTWKVRGKRVLLLDDVVTTGATLHTCASALLEAGAASVVCLAIADVQ